MALIIPNENNKQQCKCWVHIAEAPGRVVGESELGGVFDVNNEHEPLFKVKLLSIIRYRFDMLPEYFIALSSGMGKVEFLKSYMGKNSKINWDTEMGVYLYEKL